MTIRLSGNSRTTGPLSPLPFTCPASVTLRPCSDQRLYWLLAGFSHSITSIHTRAQLSQLVFNTAKMPAKTEKDPATLAHARTLANTPWCDDYEKMISGVL